MPKPLRSATVTEGRQMAGARALWRATGVQESDFGKPIIAVANSFTEFVPGHIHLRDLGALVSRSIVEAGGIAKEFNTIAVDDGIANGHDGMLYSLPSRDIIADSVEYMVNAHCADALVCISNCDKITPGMLMAAMRLNIPVIFVSGGPMEAGRSKPASIDGRIDAVNVLVGSMTPSVSDEETLELERSGCPTCGSCAGMFTANSMNCLTEALGLALPGNGSLLATHADREGLFKQAGQRIVELCEEYYQRDNDRVLPRNIANRDAFHNAMTMDIAMGGSTNTILHLLAAAQEGEIVFTMADIDRISRHTPYLSKVSPASPNYFMEDVHRAGGVIAMLGELMRAGLLNTEVYSIVGKPLAALISEFDIMSPALSDGVETFYRAGPGGIRTIKAFSQASRWDSLDRDRATGCIRNQQHAYSQDGGLAVLFGNLAVDGCIVKTAAVPEGSLKFTGTAIVFESLEQSTQGILDGSVKAGHVVVIRYEGPSGGPGMQEMLHPTAYIKSKGLEKTTALITDGRFSGASAGLSIGHVSPEAANGGAIGLIENGDPIEIDIPNRRINMQIPDAELNERRRAMDARKELAWRPLKRERQVSWALRAFGMLATSADKGAVRDRSKIR